jgi:two-component system nitrogen regulation sensor histidine kinase NtrY
MSLSLHRLKRRAELVPEDERGPVRESLASLSEGVADLARLAEQFSQYARLPEPRLERGDLVELAVAAARQHEPEQGSVTATPVTSPLPVEADRLLLSRAVHNLILNALEASPDGAGVEARLSKQEGQAVLEVLDAAPSTLKFKHAVIPTSARRRAAAGLGWRSYF